MDSQCGQMKQIYENLLPLRKKFELELPRALAAEDITGLEKANGLKQKLTDEISALREITQEKLWGLYNPRELTTVQKKENYELKETLEGHTGSVFDFHVMPNGRIVSGSADKTIKIWDGTPKQKT